MLKAQNVCFDLETTSRWPRKAEIVEIAAVAFNYDARTRKEPVIVSSFQCLVKPKYNNPEAVKIHGITNEMLKDALSFKEVEPTFNSWLSETTVKDFVWVGHNIRRYDLPILKRQSCNKQRFDHAIFDTLEIARKVYTQQKRKNLVSLYTMLRGDSSGITAHRAMGDVTMNIVLACDELKLLNSSI